MANPQYNEHLRSFEKHLVHSIDDLFQANANIVGFCNLSEAIVPINTGDAKPIYRRQYPVAYRLRDTVDAQIQKWLDTGVIRQLPQHTPWNNSLLVVPKRDIIGHTKEWRVCIDPRQINLII